MSTFDNIGGIYAKDAELRQSVNDLRSTVTSRTIKPLTVTNDGTYTANPADGVYGYSPVTVSVNQPWQPLEDGYSNFWFELTDDTLSPWLNFSSKTESAVIDWGDGSGEVALDTLTPTHTYSKAGRYIVKVKGVTQIGSLNTIEQPLQIPLIYIELANEVTSVGKWYECTHLREIYVTNPNPTLPYASFIYCYALEKVHIKNMPQTVPAQMCERCYNLKSVDLTGATTLNANAFYECRYLRNVTLPSTITTITGGNNFRNCARLHEIHCLSTIPPTLDSSYAFTGLPNDYIIYVPVSYGDTYKSAAGWSSYADHILEEGQTPTRAMLARFKKSADDDESMVVDK